MDSNHVRPYSQANPWLAFQFESIHPLLLAASASLPRLGMCWSAAFNIKGIFSLVIVV